MPSKRLHIPRNPTPQEAVALQNRLALLVSEQSDLPEQIGCVAGADVAYDNGTASGAAVLVAYDTLEQIEIATVRARTLFPYIPGFLSFREGPVAVRLLRKLKREPGVCIVDGHGRAHPRGFGLACYVGLVMNLPTIGVAKNRLIGAEAGESLLDSEGDVIATVIRSNGKNLYVSVGHKISLEDATRIVRHCMSSRGLEPVLLAHEEARKLKWSRKT